MHRNPPHARPNNMHSHLPSSINLTTFTFSQLFLLPDLISANGESVAESGNEFLVDLSENSSECIGPYIPFTTNDDFSSFSCI
ncbi:hypothetical protein ACFX14_028478 [Malus domestica]